MPLNLIANWFVRGKGVKDMPCHGKKGKGKKGGNK